MQDITVQIQTACNLDCPYCFANKLYARRLTDADFAYLISFMNRESIDFLRITGGEPLLHADIYSFLNTAFAHGIDVMLFSNFTIPFDITRLSGWSYFYVLVNLNSPGMIGDNLAEIQRRNVRAFLKAGGRISLGCNIFNEFYDFEYITAFAIEFGITKIRVAATNPSIGIDNIFFPFEKYRKLGSDLVDLEKILSASGIELFIDCPIPFCFFSQESARHLRQHASLRGVCQPRVILDCGLKLAHCYATVNIEKGRITLKDCASFSELKACAVKQYQMLQKQIPISTRCMACEYNASLECNGGCFGINLMRAN